MDKYLLVYIDDQLESSLTKYIDKGFHSDDYEIECREITFHPEEGYESLLEDPIVRTANIILIDSLLFENRTVTSGKFTGEEFKLVLKNLYPFIEVIVITQNEIEPGINKIPKYDKRCGLSVSEYYAKVLPNCFNAAVKNIKQYRLLADQLRSNDCWDTLLKDRIVSSLNGTSAYDKLTKADIDNLILTFKKVQESLNDQ